MCIRLIKRLIKVQRMVYSVEKLDHVNDLILEDLQNLLFLKTLLKNETFRDRGV